MKTVLVTGASSGIGWDTVRLLDENKFRVVATVRTLEDSERLQKTFSDRVLPIVIDLSKLDQIEQLPQRLRYDYEITKLDAVVNNAGMALAGPFLDQNFTEVEATIQLNVLAVMKLSQKMLPLLGAVVDSKHAGRIINISSIAGVSAAPFLTAYATSKRAIEGFSDGLRKELMLFGIKVIVIGPGSVKTPIWNKGFQVVQAAYVNSAYAKPFQKFISIALGEERNGLEVSEISDLILKILNAKNPKFRYAPIPRKWRNWYLPRLFPAALYNRLMAKALGLIPAK